MNTSKSSGMKSSSKSKKKSTQSTKNVVTKKNKSSPVKKIKSPLMKSANTGLLMVAPLTSSSPSTVGQSDTSFLSTPSSGLLGGRGPRVKQVCRKNATGLPRATFSSRHEDTIHNENITPGLNNEDGASDAISKDSSQSTDDDTSTDGEDDNSSASDSDALPVTEYIMRAYERENASIEKLPEKKTKKCTKKSTKTLHIRSDEQVTDKNKNGKKSNKSLNKSKSSSVNVSLDRVNENGSNSKKVTPKRKKQGQQVSKSIHGQCKVKKSKNGQSKKSISNHESPVKNDGTCSPVKKLIKKRCGTCSGCTSSDCGSCTFCLDKKKFGGPNIIKQACKLRKCTQMTSPVQ